jgi:hypothetical protein
MRPFSIGCAGARATSRAASAGRALPAGTSSHPGFVQNWPAPRVKEPTNPSAISAGRSAAAAGVTTTGLVLPSSP